MPIIVRLDLQISVFILRRRNLPPFLLFYWLVSAKREGRTLSVPIAEVALEGKEVLVETLDGLLLQDVVDAVPPVQHPHLHLRLLLPLRLGALRNLVLCHTQVRTDLHFPRDAERKGEAPGPPSSSPRPLTLLRLLLLLLDLVGDDGELGLELRRGGVSAGEVVERLPGAPQGADEALLQVGAHPGETLLQLCTGQKPTLVGTPRHASDKPDRSENSRDKRTNEPLFSAFFAQFVFFVSLR